MAALEVLVNTQAVSNLIREGKTFQIPGIIQTSSKDGMISMEHAVRGLYEAGRISGAEARLYLPLVPEPTAPTMPREVAGLHR